ncbi:MLO-like protein 1 isoform X4 [Zea mays]|uniref:MLO-like protein 1 isoform X4 n=1 Tax=Zea mays TaxID=4577 RepID=UPI0004DE8ACD|nr:MLO-like protein 1 isoform X4 [Zea mays]|eukprot:XP_008649649.1 MLO-like protein 1 isoform X4 [Zea mays]
MAEADETAALQYTPTWIVAAVCSIIVLISLAAERGLHHLGKTLKKNHQRPLYEALLKVKEELMLLGFISLLLTVLQGTIQRTCIPPSWTDYMLPCQRPGHDEAPAAAASMAARFVAADILGGISWARVLSEGEGAAAQAGLCEKEGKVPLLSLEALHQLHIFIFVLAVSHVFFCASTMLPGCAKIRKWKKWEEEIQKIAAENGPKKVLPMHQVSFIRERYKGIGTDSKTLCWLHSFRKQFYGSVAKSDYAAMRLGFIMTHCRGNLKFDFHRYMLALVDLRGDISAAQCQRLNASASRWHKAGARNSTASLRRSREADGDRGRSGRDAIGPALLVRAAAYHPAPHPLHPLPERVRARLLLLDTDDLWIGVLLHGPYRFPGAQARSRGRHSASLQLQHAAALCNCYPDGELLQEGDLQRACAAGRAGLGTEGQEEIGGEGGQLAVRTHARRRCGLGLGCRG